VTIDNNGLSGLPAGDHLVKSRQRFGVILESHQHLAFTAGLAVTDVIHPVNGVSARNKIIDHIGVATYVFAQSVNDKKHCLYLAIWQPALVVNIDIAHTLEGSINMFHILSLIA